MNRQPVGDNPNNIAAAGGRFNWRAGAAIMRPMTPPDTPAPVRLVEAALEHEGQRIDNFLLRILRGVPRSAVYRILRRGEVRVNSARARPGYRMRAGDRVRIPPMRTGGAAGGEVVVSRRVREALEAAVLLEDRHLLVLDKPAGMAVHGGTGLDHGIIEALRALRGDSGFLELAHRLDRETSGCLVLAKTPQALRALHTALRERTTEKRYLALVAGRWSGGEVVVDAPLIRRAAPGGARQVAVAVAGKPALSRFRALQRYAGATLVEVLIETGRTHQIRVHAAHLGHPVAGDTRYGDTGFNETMAGLGLNRLFLHATRILFGFGGRTWTVDAPLEARLAAVLERLENRR